MVVSMEPPVVVAPEHFFHEEIQQQPGDEVDVVLGFIREEVGQHLTEQVEDLLLQVGQRRPRRPTRGPSGGTAGRSPGRATSGAPGGPTSGAAGRPTGSTAGRATSRSTSGA